MLERLVKRTEGKRGTKKRGGGAREVGELTPLLGALRRRSRATRLIILPQPTTVDTARRHVKGYHDTYRLLENHVLALGQPGRQLKLE